jgi:hypothetical protein
MAFVSKTHVIFTPNIRLKTFSSGAFEEGKNKFWLSTTFS